MAEHGALWPACGPRCIQLKRDVARRNRDARIFVTLAIPPADKTVGPSILHEYDFGRMFQFGKRRLGLFSDFGTNEYQRSLPVADDIGHLRRSETPSYRQGYTAHLGGTEQKFEIVVAVLANISNSFARLHARGCQGVCHLVRKEIESTKRRISPFKAERDGIRPFAGMIARDVTQCGHLVKVRARQGTLITHLHSPDSPDWIL